MTALAGLRTLNLNPSMEFSRSKLICTTEWHSDSRTGHTRNPWSVCLEAGGGGGWTPEGWLKIYLQQSKTLKPPLLLLTAAPIPSLEVEDRDWLSGKSKPKGLGIRNQLDGRQRQCTEIREFDENSYIEFWDTLAFSLRIQKSGRQAYHRQTKDYKDLLGVICLPNEKIHPDTDIVGSDPPTMKPVQPPALCISF